MTVGLGDEGVMISLSHILNLNQSWVVGTGDQATAGSGDKSLGMTGNGLVTREASFQLNLKLSDEILSFELKFDWVLHSLYSKHQRLKHLI